MLPNPLLDNRSNSSPSTTAVVSLTMKESITFGTSAAKTTGIM